MTLRNYTIYFELFERKMKTVIMAKSEDHAKTLLFEKIKFHRLTIDKNDEFNKVMEYGDEVMNTLNIITK
jgi:hypothetical protein